MTYQRFIGTMLMALALAGCTMKASDFQGATPRLTVEEYFLGETQAWGLFEDRFGNLRRQFVVDIEGKMDGDVLVLDERFTYADGETDRRVWRITKIDENNYEGRADDVIGVARGVSYGNVLNWSYDMNLDVGDSTYKVHFDDWMYLQPDSVLLNRAKVTKWGFTIGEVTLAFTKKGGDNVGNLSRQNAFADDGEVAEAASR